MSFVDRFMELPVIIMYIIDKEGEEHPMEEFEETVELILPLEISSFLPDGDHTTVCMKSGRTIMTTLNLNEVQLKANAHMEAQIKR